MHSMHFGQVSFNDLRDHMYMYVWPIATIELAIASQAYRLTAAAGWRSRAHASRDGTAVARTKPAIARPREELEGARRRGRLAPTCVQEEDI